MGCSYDPAEAYLRLAGGGARPHQNGTGRAPTSTNFSYELWDEHEYDWSEHPVDDYVRRSAVATPPLKATDSGC